MTIELDQSLVDEISARMDLRAPNQAALTNIIKHISGDEFNEVVCDLATGVGKTYITAALVEYLAEQGLRNVLIVTPGKTIQDKTIDNFTPGHPKFVPGAENRPVLITAENFSRGQVGDALHQSDALKLFVFNVQQLIRPSANTSRRVRQMDEYIGADLYSHLQHVDDLVVIADEHHVYRTQARAFSAAIRDLSPKALVGLTATPDPADESKVIYRYSLAEAIADGLVKVPVIVYRRDGHNDVRTQLADACHLLRIKAQAYATWAAAEGRAMVQPVLFVVCQTVEDAQATANLLTDETFIGDRGAVLEITSQSSDEALAALASVEDPQSPIRAVVSVDKLKEGWDVKNIGVIVALRRLASQALTEQILGRGLRLPYGSRVGVPMIDQVDLVAHDSYRRLLEQKDALIERILPGASLPEFEDITSGRGERVPAHGDAANVSEQQEQGTLRLITSARVINGDVVDGAASLILQDFEATAAQGERDARTPQLLRRVKGAPTISFPRREVEVLPVRFSLALVDDSDAEAAGAGFAEEIKVPLIREALAAHRTLDGDVSIRLEAQSSETATQAFVPLSQVQRDLEERVLNLGLVEWSMAELTDARRVVSAFLRGAGANGADEVAWGAERAQQAVTGISSLIRGKYNARRLRPRYQFVSVSVPIEPRPMPTDVADRYSEFERLRWYGGWSRSILPVASFDAKTTEYALANILDSSRGISWWLRLQVGEPTYIELSEGGRYYPDFIAIDDAGVHWVIEGKSDRDADTTDTRRKQVAAEQWVHTVNEDGRFGEWRYLFCTESDIRNSYGGWETLLASARRRVQLA